MKKFMLLGCVLASLTACQSDEDILYNYFYERYCGTPGANLHTCKSWAIDAVAYIKSTHQVETCVYLIKKGEGCFFKRY